MTAYITPIITSLLDTDLYKLTMMQAVYHQFPGAVVEYEFKLRNKGIKLTDHTGLTLKIDQQIKELCKLRFTDSEIKFLDSLDLFSEDFLDFLRIMELNYNHIVVRKDGSIHIKGSWLLTILFEVPVLAIVNECYFRREKPDLEEGYTQLKTNIFEINSFSIPFADFGTRRRLSHNWQDHVISELKKKCVTFVGTSNVYFAMKYYIKPIGTMAHEWLQAGQAFTKLRDSQRFMLDKWVEEYQGNLGIALSDVIGFGAFLKDFNLRLCKLYDGVRQDSGDPYKIGEGLIKHYIDMGIDPTTKTIVFSDGLTFNKAADLYIRFKGRIKVSFGIGTNVTNNFPNSEALQIVLKMTKCNGQDVAKISDSSGKNMCNNPEYIANLKKIFWD